MSASDEPYPGYRYDAAGVDRAARAVAAARKAILGHGDGSLFDTEPQLIQKTLAALAPEDAA